MDKKTAIRIAIESMNKELQRLAVDANLHDKYLLSNPVNLSASERRAKLREAIEVLNTPQFEQHNLL